MRDVAGGNLDNLDTNDASEVITLVDGEGCRNDEYQVCNLTIYSEIKCGGNLRFFKNVTLIQTLTVISRLLQTDTHSKIRGTISLIISISKHSCFGVREQMSP